MPDKSVFTRIKQTVAQKAALSLIHGIVPMSINEWNLAQALDELKVPYEYQVRMGHQGAEGGIVLDFVAWTSHGPVAIPLRGGYWHRQSEERDNLADRIAKYYYKNLVALMVEETGTIAAARKAFLEKIGP